MDPNTTLRALADSEPGPDRLELCKDLWEWRYNQGYAPDWAACTKGARIYRKWLNSNNQPTDS